MYFWWKNVTVQDRFISLLTDFYCQKLDLIFSVPIFVFLWRVKNIKSCLKNVEKIPQQRCDGGERKKKKANWLNLSSFLKRQNPRQPKRLPSPTSGRPLCWLALAPSDRWSNAESLEDSCHRGPHWEKSSYIKNPAHSLQWLLPIHNMNCTIIRPPPIFMFVDYMLTATEY